MFNQMHDSCLCAQPDIMLYPESNELVKLFQRPKVDSTYA